MLEQSVRVAVEVIGSFGIFVIFVSVVGEATVQVGEVVVELVVAVLLVVVAGVVGVGVVLGGRVVSREVIVVVVAEVEVRTGFAMQVRD